MRKDNPSHAGDVLKGRHSRYVVGGIELTIIDKRWRFDLMQPWDGAVWGLRAQW